MKHFSEPPEVTPISFGRSVVNEGEFGQLVCTVVTGDEPFTFSWSLHGDVVSSEPGLTTSQVGGRTSILMISSVGHRHSGRYTCKVSNRAGVATTSTVLNVNGSDRLPGQEIGEGSLEGGIKLSYFLVLHS